MTNQLLFPASKLFPFVVLFCYIPQPICIQPHAKNTHYLSTFSMFHYNSTKLLMVIS